MQQQQQQQTAKAAVNDSSSTCSSTSRQLLTWAYGLCWVLGRGIELLVKLVVVVVVYIAASRHAVLALTWALYAVPCLYIPALPLNSRRAGSCRRELVVGVPLEVPKAVCGTRY
jgi:hypothetical protein